MASSFGIAARSFFVICFGTLCVWDAAGDSPHGSTALSSSLIRYDVPGGETIFALALKANLPNVQAAHDHVILVDTSASQAGEHRRQGLKILDSCLASLNEADRVCLFALDTQVKPLSDGFYAPQAAQTKDAFAKLQRRVPLGATSLQPAFDTALNSFTGSRTVLRMSGQTAYLELVTFRRSSNVIREVRTMA